jgi:AcrR family transcriptional regulator
MKEERKRSEIMQSALELIAEKGFIGAPMAMIADKAHVGIGTIYHYFKDKDTLINELYMDMEGKLIKFLESNYNEGDSVRERILQLFRGVLSYFTDHPLEFRYMEQYFNSPYSIDLRRDRIFDDTREGTIFNKLFLEGVEQKVIKDLPLVILFALSFGPILLLLRDQILGFVTLNDILIEKTIEACLDSIKR